MKTEIFKGSATALVTPFAEGGIDVPALDRLIEFQIEEGTDALVVCGTTGEAATLSADEHLSVVEHVLNRVNGRIPVIAGSGSNDTKKAVEMTRAVSDLGADAALVVTPYYNKATQNGLVRHYSLIADSSDIPVIMYNVPTRTCVDISPETAKKLSEHPNIVGLKEASPDMSKITRLFSLCGDSLAVYSGNDDLTLPILCLGGSGVISVVSNIVPGVMHRLCGAFFDGDLSESRRIQLIYFKLMKAMFTEVNPIPVKVAMEIMELCKSDVRLPMCEASDSNREKISEILRSYYLIGD